MRDALRIPVLLAALALLLPAPGGRADDLILGFESRLEWDDNVFRRPSDEDEDFVVRAGPSVRLRSEQGDLNYDVRYTPIYEGFFQEDGISGFDHFARLESSWSLSDVTQVVVEDFFSRTSSLARILEPLDPGEVAPEPEIGRDRVKRNVGRLLVRHALSRRWSTEVGFTSRWIDFSRESRTDSLSLGGDAALLHDLTKRDQVGLGIGYSEIEFDDTTSDSGVTREGDTTRYLQAFARWTHLFDPTLSLMLRAGPSRAESRDSGEDDVTVFGTAELVKRWQQFTATLRYTRDASSVPGLGQSTDVDVALARLVWKPSSHWQYSLTGSWTREQSSIDQDLCRFTGTVITVIFNESCGKLGAPPPGFTAANVETSDFDLRLWRVEGRVERRLSRNLRVFGMAVFLDQDRDRDLITSEADYDDLRIIFGFRYELDEFQL